MPQLVVTTRKGELRPVEAEEDVSVMEAIRDDGIDELLALCGGSCSCATCHVYVDQKFSARLPVMSADEDELLDGSSYRTAASRLSCQIMLTPLLDGLCVTIAPQD